MKPKAVFIIASMCLLSLPIPLPAQQDRPSFTEPSATVNAGYYHLRWQGPESRNFQIQKSSSPDFTPSEIIYTGSDTSLFLSGLPDGITYYRVRQDRGAWSKPFTLTVKHYSDMMAFGFLLCGALSFLLTVIVIIHGHRRVQASQDV